ncbi:MAG: flagellar biosynthetic protein FliQ [Deltaproteobacteria bacterium]|nr:flagellar biosynthetic protein FliQ [Sandaracinaceae bacterium]MCX7807171.1 flagellar biosynthetic protein FliQ [Deltaproteobacteria bacterium]MDW8245596.1 flagellar biosynthetic protein FliQ [Sandaracinaceae bacterium]
MAGIELGRLWMEAMALAILLSGLPLLVSLGIGLGVGLLQALTQVQEPTLVFVPKLVGVVSVLVVLGAWMGGETLRFTLRIWALIPQISQAPGP